MYLKSILLFLTWPLLILETYYLARWTLRIIEKKYAKQKEEEQQGDTVTG